MNSGKEAKGGIENMLGVERREVGDGLHKELKTRLYVTAKFSFSNKAVDCQTSVVTSLLGQFR